MKNFLCWPLEILRTAYTKLVDKVFGKRCECKDVPPVQTHCVRCGDLLKDCTCTNQAPA